MANNEQLVLITREGVDAWNQWRRKNYGVEVDLSNAKLSRLNLTGADLSRANLKGAYLSMAELGGANFKYSNLSDANLSRATLVGAYFRRANLNGARLEGACLREATLTTASAKRVNFIEAELQYANLGEAILKGSTFFEADLSGANLRGAILAEAHFRRANLRGANLSGADLRDASFKEVEIGWTSFGNNDLSVVKGLETVRHSGPSTIGVDTLYISGGKIPEDFLVGCGLPENFTAFLTSHIGAQEALQFYSCFISYSHKDEDFAKRLHSRMRDANIRVWFAPEDIKGGEKLHEQIDRAIQYHDKILIVLSESSLQSEWVMTEIRKARKDEIKRKRRKLFPIRLVEFDSIREWECFDSESGKDLAIEVREYFIPDFSNWKNHDSFEIAFGKLLNDLQAAERSE